jgi:xanthine dehydrogenase accessory factor
MVYRAVVDLMDKNEPGALCILVRTQGSTPRQASSKMLVYADGITLGTIGGGEMEARVKDEALLSIQDGKSRLLEYSMSEPQRGDPGVCGGQVEIFVEPILPIPMLVVVGCGHVGKAVAHLGHWLGFRVAVSDDRQEFCNPEVVPDADEYYPLPLKELAEQLNITRWTYVVLTTRGVDIDMEGLPALIVSPAAYIGVIGSRRRWNTTRGKLSEMGISDALIDRVTSPIGLEMGAETPEEIAVSIMAEIIMQRRGLSVRTGEGTASFSKTK